MTSKWGSPLFEQSDAGDSGQVIQWLRNGVIRVFGFSRNDDGSLFVHWEDVKRWDSVKCDWIEIDPKDDSKMDGEQP
ncbi:MAG: hypothetical protein ACOYLQ_09565 [Hyphomicrobiaceae bacterium]